jgi:hypothetical protein
MLRALLHVSVLLRHLQGALILRLLWRSWLRHCATSRKVAGSIPDGVVGIFSLI